MPTPNMVSLGVKLGIDMSGTIKRRLVAKVLGSASSDATSTEVRLQKFNMRRGFVALEADRLSEFPPVFRHDLANCCRQRAMSDFV